MARSWDDSGEPWEEHAAIVLRSTWDYHLRAREFSAWLGELERRAARVWNPVSVLRWNADKSYLLDLERAGAPVVPTAIVEAGSGSALRDVMESRGWSDVVVKPAVSATAFETWRVAAPSPPGEETRFARLVEERAMLVQPYVPEIEAAGELSFVFLGGAFSHAVRKRPRAGDFRVQHEFGGTVEPAAPAAGLVAEAAAILAAAPGESVYARVDACEVGGRLVLMELELVEPALFLGACQGAAERLARATMARIPAARQPSAERRGTTPFR